MYLFGVAALPFAVRIVLARALPLAIDRELARSPFPSLERLSVHPWQIRNGCHHADAIASTSEAAGIGTSALRFMEPVI